MDEAGDLTLFNKHGKIVVGAEGSSHCFLVGLCEIREPAALGKALEELRTRLLADPYFKGVPSMQPERRKTAVAFHAKDDVPEVRREVFTLLREADARLIVAFRRKETLARSAQERFRQTGRKLSPDDVYDDLVARVCQNQLHKADENRIVFARRGKTDRNTALEMLAPRYRLIMDLDDQREKGYGVWYSEGNPLRREKLMPVVRG